MTLTNMETTPQTVDEANLAAYTGKMNMCHAADHCGMTLKQFKLTFREYLKYHSIDEENYPL